MIDKEKVLRALEALDQLQDTDTSYSTITIKQTGEINVAIYPLNWWKGGENWSASVRHDNLSLLTPLVGKLEKTERSGDIGYSGERENVKVSINYAEKCKILGYKMVTKTVKKEVEREPEFVEVEEEQQVAITDCDIKTGRFKEEDIEVRA